MQSLNIPFLYFSVLARIFFKPLLLFCSMPDRYRSPYHHLSIWIQRTLFCQSIRSRRIFTFGVCWRYYWLLLYRSTKYPGATRHPTFTARRTSRQFYCTLNTCWLKQGWDMITYPVKCRRGAGHSTWIEAPYSGSSMSAQLAEADSRSGSTYCLQDVPVLNASWLPPKALFTLLTEDPISSCRSREIPFLISCIFTTCPRR